MRLHFHRWERTPAFSIPESGFKRTDYRVCRICGELQHSAAELDFWHPVDSIHAAALLSHVERVAGGGESE